MPAKSKKSRKPHRPLDAFVRRSSNLHEAFLRRAADAPDGSTSGCALGAFLALRLVDVYDARFERLSRDALAYQIRATRDYLNDVHPVTAEVKHLQEIVRVAEVGFRQRNRRLVWPPVLAFAYFLEQHGRLEEALDALETVMFVSDGRDAEEEVQTLLQRARVLRLLGQLDDAEQAYAAAGAMAQRIGDLHSERLSRIGRGIVLQVRGNLPASEHALRQVLEDARAAQDRDAEARASHDLAVTYCFMKRFDAGVPLAFRAFELYERPDAKLRALSDLGLLLVDMNWLDAAEDAFRIVLEHAGEPAIEANAVNELMAIASRRGDRLGFERWRKHVEQRLSDLPAETRTDFHLKVGLGLVRFGASDTAREHIDAALATAEQYRLNQFVFQAEAALAELDRATQARPSEVRAEAHADSQLAVVAERLHELRWSAAV